MTEGVILLLEALDLVPVPGSAGLPVLRRRRLSRLGTGKHRGRSSRVILRGKVPLLGMPGLQTLRQRDERGPRLNLAHRHNARQLEPGRELYPIKVRQDSSDKKRIDLAIGHLCLLLSLHLRLSLSSPTLAPCGLLRQLEPNPSPNIPVRPGTRMRCSDQLQNLEALSEFESVLGMGTFAGHFHGET